MSIYSGFATRNQEQAYDQCIYDMLFVLQKRILKFYSNIDADQDKFWSIFSQLFNQMILLQKNKYLQPKSSQSLTEIYHYLKLQKQKRDQDPQEDLKKFQRSMAIRLNPQQQVKVKQTQINNFIRATSFSFGKIKKQIDPNNMASLSVQTIDRKGHLQIKNLNDKLINAQTRKVNEKRSLSLKEGTRNAKSFRQEVNNKFDSQKTKPQGSRKAQEVVKNYLEKTNKNYLRGIRKRKVRDEYLQSMENQIDLQIFSKGKDMQK